MELQVLFSGVPYTGTLPQGEAVLVTQDSRRACPGAVFVCARGMTTDGHDHARKALEAGAVCIVTERPLGLPGEVQVASGRKAYAQLCQNFFGRPAGISGPLLPGAFNVRAHVRRRVCACRVKNFFLSGISFSQFLHL